MSKFLTLKYFDRRVQKLSSNSILNLTLWCFRGFASSTLLLRFQLISWNFKNNRKSTQNCQKLEYNQNNCRVWMKSGRLKRWISVVYKCLLLILVRIRWNSFQQIFRPQEISLKFRDFWDEHQNNFLFKKSYTVEYSSEFHEK